MTGKYWKGTELVHVLGGPGGVYRLEGKEYRGSEIRAMIDRGELGRYTIIPAALPRDPESYIGPTRGFKRGEK